MQRPLRVAQKVAHLKADAANLFVCVGGFQRQVFKGQAQKAREEKAFKGLFVIAKRGIEMRARRRFIDPLRGRISHHAPTKFGLRFSRKARRPSM